MALIDFSKAFDRVWREELLLAASSKGLPIPFARWLRGVLSNRIARAQINGERGGSAPLRQGLPQGTVLFLLLFLLYIDDLRSVVPETVKVTLFADDVGVQIFGILAWKAVYKFNLLVNFVTALYLALLHQATTILIFPLILQLRK